MCYDMSFFSNIKLIADYLNIQSAGILNFEPTFHKVAQSFSQWPVVVKEDGQYKIRLFEWGVIADYMNTPEKIKDYRTSMANARSEKILDDKRSVWHRLHNQRCLVFTTGFFEHRDIQAKKKLPYFIRVKHEPLFCFAGLYNYSPLPNPETGEAIGTFTVITRPANTLMAKIHNAGPNSQRMPLMLSKELAVKWLDEHLSDQESDEILRFEFPAGQMEAWPVNTIRTRKTDDESVITKLPEELFPAL
jgi:putative SOS response-associated peptidase YedK